MKKATRKRNLDEDKAQAQKDKAVAFLRRVGNDDAADKLEDESLESYAVRKGIRVDKNPCRKPVSEIGDRAKRYRAHHPDFIPALPKKCALCRSTRNIEIDHKDGDESNGARRNLRWLCRSCNAQHGVNLKRAGRGKRASRTNPGARTLGQYIGAVTEHTRGRHDAGGKIIHETPKAKREEFAKQIWRRRRLAGTDRKMNPAKKRVSKKRKRNTFGLDRFFGSKPRVTSTDWNRAGEARRAAALRSAGVAKKLLPVYTDLSWRDMQGLDSKFVTKVMSGLPKRNSRRPKARKPAARKRLRVKTKKNTSTSAIGKKIRALMLDGMSRREATKAAQRLVRSGRTKPGKYKRGARRNPGSLERAGETYAMFHGRDAKEVVTVKELGEPHDLIGKKPSVTAGLGDMICLIMGDGDDAYRIAWGKGEQPLLATDPKARQLYIVGGDQSLEPMMRQQGVKATQDVVDLGEVSQMEYYTQKQFDDFEPIVYYHQFGEEDAKRNPRGRVRRPRLIYSRRNRKMMLTGGAYKIKKDGIIN
jgi:hypothetical protein